MHAHRQRREKTTKNVYSTLVGSAALPGSEASNYTYTKVHEKINHYNKAEKTRETLTRQRPDETEERTCKSAREQEERERGTGWSCAYDRGSCHVTGRGNQSAPVS